LAVILVLTFTVVSGLISPRARRPKRRRKHEEPEAAMESPRLVEALAS
jgi:hypothetical protein